MTKQDFLKDHIDYPTVLDECHKKGIQSIEILRDDSGKPWVEFITDANGMVTVMTGYRVTLKDGTVWEEIGDANEQNVGNRLIAQHKIRMAATRAKGRAMRDAINKGKPIQEEFDQGDDGSTQEPNRNVQDARDQRDGGSDLFREYVILRDQYVSLSDEYPNAAALEKKLKAVINVPEDTLMRDVNSTVLQRLIDTLKARIENARKVPA